MYIHNTHTSPPPHPHPSPTHIPIPHPHHSQPFSKPRGWLAWALAGLASAPLVVAAVAAVSSLFVEEVAGRGTVDAVAGIIDLSPTSYIALLTVTSVLAPLLEETVFRGFLLTSLTKYGVVLLWWWRWWCVSKGRDCTVPSTITGTCPPQRQCWSVVCSLVLHI